MAALIDPKIEGGRTIPPPEKHPVDDEISGLRKRADRGLNSLRRTPAHTKYCGGHKEKQRRSDQGNCADTRTNTIFLAEPRKTEY